MTRIQFTAILLLLPMLGCGSTRPAKTQPELLAARDARQQEFNHFSGDLIQRLMVRVKSEYDDQATGKTAQPPTLDLLVISGGGDWGAFGAGFLKGWGQVKGPMARPKFDAVTGVSTGALIAPFAYVGDDESINTVENIYRHPQPDWVEERWPFYFWPSNESFATVPGLERELRDRVTMPFLKKIAAQSQSNRALLVNTTNVDDGDMWVWDVGQEAQHAVETGNSDRVMLILLASAGIPAAFPFRIIDGVMYVDGGVTGNILYGGRTEEDSSFPAVWQKAYPNLPIPQIRYWVIFNNQIRPAPQVTEPKWPAVIARSMEMSTRAATLTSMRHLFAQAEISRLKRNSTIEVRIVAVPDNWVPPKPGIFTPETMNTLADLGEKMGADPASWMTESP
jgi:hypothetical protein